MKRRKLLSLSATAALGAVISYTGRDVFFESGILNPCEQNASRLSELLAHPLIVPLMAEIDFTQVWDTHVHLVGTGDSGSGIWVTPQMQTMKHPWQWLQFQMYLNASCSNDSSSNHSVSSHLNSIDQNYVERLLNISKGVPEGARWLLLAFDYNYDQKGKRQQSLSSFHTPNQYAAEVASQHESFEWIASIHPYRQDALDELDRAKSQNARGVKWLPPAMGIDPSSVLCDPFYDKLVELNLPLLCHAGEEKAVHGADAQVLGNPLKLRRALDRGVNVIVAHCASLGEGIDLDDRLKSSVSNFSLFSRLMDDDTMNSRLYGDLSATTQVNREPEILKQLLTRTDWHNHLVSASDYPLPGVMPLFSTGRLARSGLIANDFIKPLQSIRELNPWLYDFLLRRALTWQGHSFSKAVFETQRVFVS